MSNVKDQLGDRMKGYEAASKTILPRRVPVIIRVDGKAFHTYTKSLPRPWCDSLTECMDQTAIALCKGIQGAQMAYVQSDEISVLVHGYKTLEAEPWFGNEVQKMVSVSAGIASATFTLNSSNIFMKTCPACRDWEVRGFCDNCNGGGYIDSEPRLAVFDSRVFVLPESEVCNYFLWRQQDATRNSVQMLARSLYSHKELNDKNNSELQDLCHAKGQNWNDVPTRYKRGRCIVKVERPSFRINPKTNERVDFARSVWEADNEIPVFSQDRKYVNKFLAINEV